jgi:hypothetical protein
MANDTKYLFTGPDRGGGAGIFLHSLEYRRRSQNMRRRKCIKPKTIKAISLKKLASIQSTLGTTVKQA